MPKKPVAIKYAGRKSKKMARITIPDTSPGKGQFGGFCNRMDCLSPIDVCYFNYSTRKFYCEECATMLNEENKHDSHELFGHDLCIKMDQCPGCKGTGRSKHDDGPCCICNGEGYLWASNCFSGGK